MPKVETLKVIYWVSGVPIRFNGSPYEIPRFRYEYLYRLEGEGWRKVRRTIKSGTMAGDREYGSDWRNLAKTGKGRVVSEEVYSDEVVK